MSNFGLYEFQLDDCDKLETQTGALIASEMGVGKTHEAIELFIRWTNFRTVMPTLDKRMPSLVIAPLNTHKSWMNKFAEQAPHIRVFRIDRKNRDDFILSMLTESADVYLIHWQALHLLVDSMEKFSYSVIIADEVHRASNRESKTTKALKRLKSTHKLGMSGTMAGDKPDKLWSILNWVHAEQFPSYWGFRSEYIVDEYNYSGYREIIDVQNTEHLHELVRPYYVRHLKREACCDKHPNGVMHWLPGKSYEEVEVELTLKQRRLYDQMEKEMVAWVGDNGDNAMSASVVIAQLTRLSQMAIATPTLVPHTVRRPNPMHELDPTEPEYIEEIEIKVQLESPSSKIDAAQELIEDHPDESIVLFSSSRQACYLAAEQFQKAGITCRVLSGSTPQQQRDEMIQDFQDKKFRVFIGVIAAVGEGVDGLQHASHIAIFLDRSWTSLENKQAEDRLDRGGQLLPVQIFDIMAKDTCDLARHTRLRIKHNWLRKVLGDHVLPDDDEEELEAA